MPHAVEGKHLYPLQFQSFPTHIRSFVAHLEQTGANAATTHLFHLARRRSLALDTRYAQDAGES
jgi:hypothetical protein